MGPADIGGGGCSVFFQYCLPAYMSGRAEGNISCHQQNNQLAYYGEGIEYNALVLASEHVNEHTLFMHITFVTSTP